jgi:hypothetical protein
MRAHPIKTAFNAGELSPLLDGRIDIAKYGSGCKLLQNFFPTVEGAAVRRGGTRFALEVKDSGDRCWLGKFEFNTEQAYVLEFGDEYIRFFTQGGYLATGSVTAWNSGTAYVVGNLASSSGVNYYCIAAHTNQLPPNATYWYPLTDDILEVPTPYALADLTGADGTFQLRMTQTGDIIYIVHPEYPVQKLSRYSNTRWTLEEAVFEGGPFQDQNSDDTITVYSSAASGSVTLTASSSIFTSSMVGSLFYIEVEDFSDIGSWEAGKTIATAAVNPNGRLIRSDGKTYACAENTSPGAGNAYRTGGNKPTHTEGMELDGDGQPVTGTSSPAITKQGIGWTFQDPGYGFVRITGYTSGTSVSATVVSDWNLPANVVGSGKATYRWAKAAFSDAEGYPSEVTFFRERLTFVKGQTIYMSVSGDFENFQTKTYGEQLADNAIVVTVQSDKVNDIRWISAGRRLLIGTAGGEFVLGEQTTTDPLGPTNIKIEQQTGHGSANIVPARIGDGTVFVQRSGRKVREVRYAFDTDSYQTSDLTVLARHITQSGFIDMVYQQEPYTLLWAVRADGLLVCFTFNKEQDVLGWSRHPIGGAFGSGSAVVEAVQVIPSVDGDRDELWMIVKRTVDGNTVRYVEYLTAEYQDGDDAADCLYLDGGLTYDGAAADTITGLDHLEGQTLGVLADGAAHPDVVVATGSVTLQREASVVQLGLKCPAMITTNRIEAGARLGTAQGKTKRLHRVIIRFLNTLGGKAGPNENNLETILFRRGSDLMDSAPPVQSGDFKLDWPSGYETDGYVTIRQDQPFPMTVVSIMPELVTYE